MARCLFTDEELDGETREEHTIPRSLGGRIRSREVSSSTINNCCAGMDGLFADVYGDTMAILGPLLPTESRRGSRTVRVDGHPGNFVVDGFGRLDLRGPAIMARDEQSGKPTVVMGSDHASLERIASQSMSGQVWTERCLPPNLDATELRRPVSAPAFEIAALKATLLSFDHLLRCRPDRFTRLPELRDAREFVRDCILGAQIDARLLGHYSLGLQYDGEYPGLYRRLRSAVLFPESPFEHVLLASANPATRTLDLVFWAFRTDPYAFRVCSNWQGEAFTYMIVNGILAGTTCSEAIQLDGSYLLAKATRWRSYRYVTLATPPDEGQVIRDRLFEQRCNLYRQAVDYVERHCDDHVLQPIQEMASLNKDGDHRVRSAIAKRLQIAFNSRIQATESRVRFDEVIAGVLANAPNDCWPDLKEGEVAPCVDWPMWLAFYRQCLDALHPEFGLPGDVVQRGGCETVCDTLIPVRP